MTPEREKQILASLYDRLYDAVTYAPDGKSPGFKKGEVVFQMAKNLVIDPADFANMMTPRNPKGDLRSAQVFSAFVDEIPKVDTLWQPSGEKVSKVYSDIVGKANTLTQPTAAQQAIYNKAYQYLNVETTSPPDMYGNSTSTVGPSAIAQTYDDNQSAYVSAIGGYRTAYNGYDLDKITDQRAWNAVEPGLSLNVDKAWNAWVRGGKPQVEQAQGALVSTINDAVRFAISEAQRLTNESHKFADQSGGPEKWLPSYALPGSWMQASSLASKLAFTSAYLNEKSSDEAHSYGASFKVQSGLWHAAADASGSHQEQNYHMDAQNLTISAELIAVTIQRPWFNPLIFGMKNWFVTGFDANGISSGNPSNLTGTMPLVPTGFVVCRNVKISADFSDKDKQIISDSHKAEASGGWGPFTISAKYGYDSKKSKSESKFDGSTLELPGLQVIAWISAVTKASPAQAAAAV